MLLMKVFGGQAVLLEVVQGSGSAVHGEHLGQEGGRVRGRKVWPKQGQQLLHT